MTHSFEFDPAEVLETPDRASLEQIRDAYRAKTKKYHPDTGGDEWAFRLVVRSYELLSQARVAGYLEDAAPEPAAPRANRASPIQDPVDGEGVSVRRGVRDNVPDPILLVDAESLILRMEFDNPYEVISAGQQDRNLSCSLSVTWPSRAAAESMGKKRDPASLREIEAKVTDAFVAAAGKTNPQSSWHQCDDGRFSAMLAFPGARATGDALLALRAELKARGLGISQWTREVVIPRERD